jgi:predicted RecB family nuclease
MDDHGASRGAAHGTGDVPEVRLDAYAARSCPVRAQWDVVRPCTPADDPPLRAALAARGRAFEARILTDLRALHPDAVIIDASLPTGERETRTLAALAAGARLIVGPRLPHDPLTGRVGAPDLLVRYGASGYAPVDVKHHATLDRDADRVTGLADLGRVDAAPPPRAAGTYGAIRGDVLQLAHYWRMLATLDLAAPGTPTGAIIGKEAHVVWLDLVAPRFTRDGAHDRDRVGALALYDLEHAERLRIARAAAAHVADPSQPLARAPVRIAECPSCRWREHCGELLPPRQDVSLLPRVGQPAWEALARVGRDTIPLLAAIPDGTRVAGMEDGALTAAVMQARAHSGPDVAYRRPGVAAVEVERADVELDVDMENVEDGAYLWGVHVTDRVGSGIVPTGYHAFVDWDPDAAIAGARAFAAFWTWLEALRTDCAARGLTLRAYCWHAPAENRWLTVGGQETGVADAVARFTGGEQWVDLRVVLDRQLVTGHRSALKVVAGLLGFAWADEDPDGGTSMLWWEDAVGTDRPEHVREAARARLLTYNADDVRATLHVREWLTREGPHIRAVLAG